ncbi:MAG: hypothetical protein D6727_03955 [Gammaproteobacteria bacterium]|nr:MAG: hypothetical protein D6727_03955 [Gammaproteobacteria bacterium]
MAAGQGPDPVLVEVPIAYVKRPLPVNGMGGVTALEARELLVFETGADLYLRERASPTAAERNLTAAITQGMGDVRDVEVSWDGDRLLFALRGPLLPGVPAENQPSWNIWEYDIPNDQLRRVIASDIVAEAGQDRMPHYLPDGRILFTSTRQRQAGAILLDEGKPQFAALDEDRNEPAFVLHVMDADGSNIRQISFNQSHDLDPAVLSDGRIVFSRWDHAGGNDAIHLYRAKPDGSGLELLYGRNSHATGSNGAIVQFLQPREMPDGSLLCLLQPFTAPLRGGDLVQIDIADYVENRQPNRANAGVLNGPAQVRPLVNDVRTDGSLSPGGHFASAFPLWDGTGRLLVSWSQCAALEGGNTVPCTPARLADPNTQPAPPAYGIWVYDPAEGTQQPIVPPEAGMVFSDVVAAQARNLPPIIPDQAPMADPNLVAEGAGILNIRSVYDVDGVDTAAPDIPTLADPLATPPDARPARFLRIVKAVGIPEDTVLNLPGTAFGRSAVNGMREIIGYLPIEPDGSVQAKVPANVPLQISVLDAEGRRIGPRHNAWLQLRPGERRNCNGCHDRNSGRSHGRDDAFDTAYPGALTTGQPFPNTDPAIFADFGETMAEARARLSCATDCAAITPSVDLVYSDVWTDPALQAPAAPFAYRYADLQTPAPASAACQTAWTPLCRSVINYVDQLQPLWELPRLAADGVTDVTCVSCHRRVDAMGNPMVPQGQLDLSGVPDPVVSDHLVSYRELLFTDNAEEFDPVQGILRDILVQVGTDPVTGNPILQPVPVPPSMSVAGAAASDRFFSRFAAGGTHEGWLSAAELRLISEWLDIGAQYFNNPFDVPIN